MDGFYDEFSGEIYGSVVGVLPRFDKMLVCHIGRECFIQRIPELMHDIHRNSLRVNIFYMRVRVIHMEQTRMAVMMSWA